MVRNLRLISLSTRAVLYVSIALLPLGFIALWQTGLILQDQRHAGERGMIALSEKAAARDRQIMERAIGGAAALATSAFSLKDRPALCRTVLRRFVGNSALYTFVAFFDDTNRLACASVPSEDQDLLDTRVQDLPLRGDIAVYRSEADDVAGPASLVVVTPVLEDGAYRGQLQLHVSPQLLFPRPEASSDQRPAGLITFNNLGQVLTVEDHKTPAALDFLPPKINLAELTRPFQYAFDDTARNGQPYRYIVLPLVPDAVYALATWPSDAALINTNRTFLNTTLFAVAAWAVSVLTVYLIMHRLVIRGIKRLSRQMSRFNAARQVPEGAISGRGELYAMEEGFRTLARALVEDEQKLEASVHEKDVLLKEVHHRVKNNLQLINSIINMVLRGKPSDETVYVVRRLQDRVLALASVHRMIYEAEQMDRVDAAPIVEEVVNQSIAVGVPKGSKTPVSFDLDAVVLYPDQALPLILLVSEAITNALKYSQSGDAQIAVSLKAYSAPEEAGAQRRATLEMTNVVHAQGKQQDFESTSLGSKLMRAFASQLDGELCTNESEGEYHLRVDFPVADFEAEKQSMSAGQG